MKKTIRFLITGVGGQGTILASDSLAEVGLRLGHDAKKSDILGLAVRGGVMRIGLLARSERRGGSVAALPGAEVLQELRGLRKALDVQQQLAVLLGGFPTRGGDVHQPEAAQLLDEILTLRRKEHKVVF